MLMKLYSKKALRVFTAFLLVFSLVICFVPAQGSAEGDAEYEQKLSSLNDEKAAAREKRISAQSKVQELKNRQTEMIEEKVALEERNAAALEEIAIIREQIALIREEIKAADDRIAEKEKDVSEALDQENAQLEKYRSRIRAMEENSGYNILAVILNSDSFSTLLSGIDDYAEVMESDQTLYDQLQLARQNHERLEAEYVAYKAECEEKKAKYESDRAALEAEQKDLEMQIAESEAEIEEYTHKIAEAEAEAAAAEKAEAAASAAAASFTAQYYAAKAAAQAQPQAAPQPQTRTETVIETVLETIIDENGEEQQVLKEVAVEKEVPVEAEAPAASSGVFADGNGTGSYVWPFPGHYIITSPFGQRPSTGSYHTGVDIDGFQSMGSAIVASDSGTVIKAEYYRGYGNCIIIDHGNNMSTLYAHLSSMSVGVGSSVTQGQTIGGVGNTGTCYGADGIHLHFEVMTGGQQVDPLGYLPGVYSFYN